jgi:hypothetical protein
MKKVLFLTTIAALSFAACGGNESAYTEQEKTSQDSLDQMKQEDDFESLMNDTASKDSVSTKPEKYTPSKGGEAVTIPSK